MRVGGVIVFAAIAAVAQCDTEIPPYHYVGALAGQSAILFGSSEIRNVEGIFYGYAKPEPRFRVGSILGSLVYEGYANHTYSIDYGKSATPTNATGFLAFARWEGRPSHGGLGVYFDFGWGFQYASVPTRDLPSEINSTPWGGVGVFFPVRGHETMLGMRFFHISNAGLVTPNRGQDEVQVTLQYKL